MWHAQVETDTGDILRVILPGDGIAGKALLAFTIMLAASCHENIGAKGVDLAWIKEFNEASAIQLCDLAAPLNRSIYSGDLDYRETEYELFRQRSPNMQVTESEFIAMIEHASDTWTETEAIIGSVEGLLTEFEKGYLQERHWYNPVDTIQEFEALLSTLVLCRDRHAKKARINIL